MLNVPWLTRLIGRRRLIPEVEAEVLNRHFLRWLDRRDGGPWFAFLNYYEAHDPYLPPSPYDRQYTERRDSVASAYWSALRSNYGAPPVDPEALADNLDHYDGAISYLDRQIDALLRELDRRGELGNTIIVVTADHGELFGEHGVIGHGNNLYLPVLHVPLIVIAPGRVPAGMRVPAYSSLRDLPATLLELAAVPNPGLPGRSLAAKWSRPARLGADTLFAAVDYDPFLTRWPPNPLLRGSMRTVVLDRFQYILNGDGAEELYELSEDHWQTRNLADHQAYQTELLRHRLALRKLAPSTH